MDCENSSVWPSCFVSDSIREAVLTVSPIAVYSSRRSEPMLPDISGPLIIPTPIRKPSP